MSNTLPLFTANTADAEQAYAIILDHYGSLDGHTIELFRDGFDHIVYVVDGEDAFRFPKNQEYADKLPVVSRFLQKFAPFSPIAVPVPEVLSGYHITFEKYQFLPGKPLTEKLAGTFSDYNLENIAATIGSFLTALHSFPVTDAVDMGITKDSPLDEWQRRYAAAQQHVFPLLQKVDTEWIDNSFSHFFSVLSRHEPEQVVIHFDIKPDHIIVDPTSRNLNGIIDFGDMRIGDPAYDFTYFARYTYDLTGPILKAYQRETDTEFMKRVSFYQATLPLMDLTHAIEIGAKDKIEPLKDALHQYITQKTTP